MSAGCDGRYPEVLGSGGREAKKPSQRFWGCAGNGVRERAPQPQNGFVDASRETEYGLASNICSGGLKSLALHREAERVIGFVAESTCPLCKVRLAIHDGRGCCPCCGDSYLVR